MKKQYQASEHDMQATVIQWARVFEAGHPELECLIAVPNAGKRSYMTGQKFKREGMSAGVPDLLLLAPSGNFCGAAIEMKKPGNKPTAHQLEWLRRLKRHGWATKIAYSADDAIDFLRSYLGLKN